MVNFLKIGQVPHICTYSIKTWCKHIHIITQVSRGGSPRTETFDYGTNATQPGRRNLQYRVLPTQPDFRMKRSKTFSFKMIFAPTYFQRFLRRPCTQMMSYGAKYDHGQIPRQVCIFLLVRKQLSHIYLMFL